MKKELFPSTGKNRCVFYKDGQEYYECFLAMIRASNQCIHLQTYIFEIDQFGSRVRDELIAAAQRGVKVYLLVDSIGSRNLSPEQEKNFRDAGIEFCRFNSIQIKWLYRWGRRLHHKILLIDYQDAIIGGINVLYACPEGALQPQLDFAVQVAGPAITHLSYYCQIIFKKASRNDYRIETIEEHPGFADGHDLEISINDWIHGRSKITRQYSRITTEAKKEITIINSYFFPRRKFMKQLTKAAARGVRVRLILPKYSDWPSYILASEHLYEYFLERGVEIYRWEKSVLHGKLATVDDNWSTIGSFNLNYTSYQQNLEMNVDIYSRDFTRHLNQEIEQIIKNGCERVELSTFSKKASLKTRVARVFFYLLLSIIANFSIGLSFQEDHNKEHRFFHILRIIGSIFFFIIGLLGAILPVIPGFPFFILSFLLVYRQILLNRKAA